MKTATISIQHNKHVLVELDNGFSIEIHRVHIKEYLKHLRDEGYEIKSHKSK